MSPATAGVGGKGNREEGWDMGDISKEEIAELQDRIKTENEREVLKMPARFQCLLHGNHLINIC